VTAMTASSRREFVVAGAGAAPLPSTDRRSHAGLNWLVAQPVDHLGGLSGNVRI
jgi:hypothetical protein